MLILTMWQFHFLLFLLVFFSFHFFLKSIDLFYSFVQIVTNTRQFLLDSITLDNNDHFEHEHYSTRMNAWKLIFSIFA